LICAKGILYQHAVSVVFLNAELEYIRPIWKMACLQKKKPLAAKLTKFRAIGTSIES
jgi:hypothetical protein